MFGFLKKRRERKQRAAEQHLTDLFAAAAMEGFIASNAYNMSKDIGRAAYVVADNMMAERAKRMKNTTPSEGNQ